MVEKNKNTNTNFFTAGVSLQSLIGAIEFQPNLKQAFYLSSIYAPHPYGKQIYTNPLFNKVKRKLEKELLHNNKISFHLSWHQFFSDGHALAVYKEKEHGQIRFYDANNGETTFDTVGDFIAMLERHYDPAHKDSRVPSGASFQLRRYYSENTAKNFWHHFFKYKALNPWYYLTWQPLNFLTCTTMLLSMFIPVFGPISIALAGCMVLALLVNMGIIAPIVHAWDSLTDKIQSYFPSIFPVQNIDKPSHKLPTNFNKANQNGISMNNDDQANNPVSSNGSKKEKTSSNVAVQSGRAFPPLPNP